MDTYSGWKTSRKARVGMSILSMTQQDVSIEQTELLPVDMLEISIVAPGNCLIRIIRTTYLGPHALVVTVIIMNTALCCHIFFNLCQFFNIIQPLLIIQSYEASLDTPLHQFPNCFVFPFGPFFFIMSQKLLMPTLSGRRAEICVFKLEALPLCLNKQARTQLQVRDKLVRFLLLGRYYIHWPDKNCAS